MRAARCASLQVMAVKGDKRDERSRRSRDEITRLRRSESDARDDGREMQMGMAC